MTEQSFDVPERLMAALVLASDVHIKDMEDRRGQLLLDVVRRLGANVETFVLNGDIFDFCFGDSEYFRYKYRLLGEALEAAAARGIRVVFIEGNHEFHMDRIGWKGVEVVQKAEWCLELCGGGTVKICHGDLLLDEPLYRGFRRVIKSRFVRWVAKQIPAGWLDAYALWQAGVSRSQDRYRELNHGRILAAFRGWFGCGPYIAGIIGHFHVAYGEPGPRVGTQLLSVECWDRPNLLVYDQGRFGRVYLTEPSCPFVIEPVQPLFPALAQVDGSEAALP